MISSFAKEARPRRRNAEKRHRPVGWHWQCRCQHLAPNVWRIFQAIDLTGSDQVARYDDGIGSSFFKPLAIVSGAFGWGLKRNVIDLYKFICRNYGKDSKIYGFGFSRGAFTIRVLIGLVARQGVKPFQSAESGQ